MSDPAPRSTYAGDPSHRLRGGVALDHKSDDNADDSCAPNYAHNSALRLVNRPFRRSAWSWQCAGQGFESA